MERETDICPVYMDLLWWRFENNSLAPPHPATGSNETDLPRMHSVRNWRAGQQSPPYHNNNN